MRVSVIDPAAYTPPYDRALCAALAQAGADVELVTAPFPHGEVPPARGYTVREDFYRFAPKGRGRRWARLLMHIPDMLRASRRGADIVHFQWLAVQPLDQHLLRAYRRPRVVTAHDVLPREPKPGQIEGQRELYGRMDAIVVHTEHGRARLVDELGLPAQRVHVIPHGILRPAGDAVLPPELAAYDGTVVLCFGLLRPYKGIDVLLDAWRALDPEAELWIVGMPRMDIAALRSSAPRSVRWVARFIADDELGAYFERADLVVLPYREIDQSGVLYTALAFGKPLLLSAVGGFPEVEGAALVPPGDAGALAAKLTELLRDPPRAAAATVSWDEIARRTLELYAALQT